MLLLFIFIIIFLMTVLLVLQVKGVITEDFLIKQPKTKKDIKKSIYFKLLGLVLFILSIFILYLTDFFSQSQLVLLILISAFIVLFVIADIINDFIKLNPRLLSLVNSTGFRVGLIFLLFRSFITFSLITIPI